jgi:uncharacterized Ntn-hydrolase superfamily protein
MSDLRSCMANARNRTALGVFSLLLLSGATSLTAQRPVHTYSIVARDSATGQLGVAVQSHWFSVGSLVTWAEAGVGAIATQSFIDPGYGALGLELLRRGKNADETLRALIAADPHPEVRQVAIVDAMGGVAAHTGDKSIEAFAHRKGRGYSTQANLMLKNTVPDAMARAYENAKGDFAERLLIALEAAQAEGGDIRGSQSAAILIVNAKSTGKPWADKVIDLRVEDNKQPLVELRRLVNLARAYARMNAGDEAVTNNDLEKATKEYAAAEAMVADSVTNGEMVFWHAVLLANTGKVEESLPLFQRAFKQDKNWAELVKRLPKAGQLPNDRRLMDRITALAK